MARRRKTSERDFIAIADAFARDAVADVDHAKHCHYVRLAASRYLKDRKRAAEKGGPFKFSHVHAREVCEFAEQLPHVEGTWDTDTITLHRSHVFFLVNLFGFRNHDGTRRYTVGLFAVARKNAKSTLAAVILLYCLCYEKEPGPQVITAATTGDQARIIFNIAKRMVEKTTDLREAFNLEVFANAVTNWQVGGNLKPINAHASTQDGLNPSHTALDEIHAHKTHDLLNVLQSASGARKNPLWLYLTTEGYETPGPWPEMRKFAQQVLSGLLEADHFFPLIFQLDDQIGEPDKPGYRKADDDFDESKWVKANPLMEVNPILAREIRKAALEAKQETQPASGRREHLAQHREVEAM
jgi:phage terminase large subunit-like protein